MFVTAGFTVLFLLLVLCFVGLGFLYYKFNELPKNQDNVQNAASKEDLDAIISEKIQEIKVEKGPAGPPGPQGPRGEMGLQGDSGLQGPAGPQGQTLIQNGEELFTGVDDIKIFGFMEENVYDDQEQLNNVTAAYADSKDRKEAIEKIKENMKKSASFIHDFKQLRDIRNETRDMTKDVLGCYERYCKAFERLYHSEEDESIRKSLGNACRAELNVFQDKILKYNQNLKLLDKKRRDFFLREKVE